MIARICLLALVGVLLNAQDPAQRNVNAYSKEAEAALGARLAGEVQKRTSALGDSTVHKYVERLGRQLAGHVPDGDWDWDFGVIRDDVGGSTHEAVSLPGGHIFVSASLILATDSEAELAGMVAHSITHIAERHGTRMATRAQAAYLSSIPFVFRGWMGMGAGTDDRAFLPIAYLPIQRSNELDADRVAVDIMAADGYDPAALVEYIRRTERAPTAESRMYSALPSRDERIRALEAAISDLPSRAARWSGEFKAIQNRVRELAVSSRGEPPSLLKQRPSLRRKDER